MSMTFATKVVKQKGTNELITGTGTAGTKGSSTAAYKPSLWTFNIGMTPVVGDIITVKVPVAGVNAGIWISVNNGTTYYPAAIQSNAMLTTHFPVNSPVMLVYETGMKTKMYGNTKDGGAAGATATEYTMDRWRVMNVYDSNTTYSSMSQAEATTGTATSARSITAKVLNDTIDGKLISITNTEIDNLFT